MASAEPNRAAVLVAGSHGFLGLAVVRALASAGFRPRGLVRRAEQAELISAAGGAPVLGDVLDPTSLSRACEGCWGVVHLAATYPGPSEASRLAEQVRVDGARHLVRAARAAGAARLVVGSGYWVYADAAGPLRDDAPLAPRGESRVNFEAENAAKAEAGDDLDVMVVRPGMVYGDGSWLRGMVEEIRAGTYRLPGTGMNHWSLVERADAGRAFAAVLERGRAGRAYLVVDDHPIPVRELAGMISRAFGREEPPGVPLDALARSVGDDVAYHLAANRAGDNARIRALGWVPRQPDPRVGVPDLLHRWP